MIGIARGHTERQRLRISQPDVFDGPESHESFDRATLESFFAVKRAFDSSGLLNPGKAVPTLARCAEYGKMHVQAGRLSFPDLPRV